MKKLIFFFAMVFAGGMTIAQSNEAMVTQKGDGNEGLVNQAGQDHTVTITQSNWGLPGHYASVDQSGGNSNNAVVVQEQRGAAAIIRQIGSDNEAGLIQAGPNDAGDKVANTAGIYQQGNNNLLSNENSGFTGSAYQKNGTSFDNDKNWLQVDQIGDFNKVGVNQEHHAKADFYQEGNYNEARIRQHSNAGGVLNTASITQYNDNNEARIHQFGGEGNEAHIIQNGEEKNAWLVQNGSENLFKLEQIRGGNTVGVEGNAFTQLGNGNKFAGVNYNTGDLSFNEAGYALQEDGATLDLSSFQTGNNNVIGLRQGENDLGLIQQLGDDNQALLWQEGGGHDATILQTGNGNSVSVIQQ